MPRLSAVGISGLQAGEDVKVDDAFSELPAQRTTDGDWRSAVVGNARTPGYRLRITRSPSTGPLVGKWLLRHRNRVKFRILVHQNRIGLQSTGRNPGVGQRERIRCFQFSRPQQ
jgi:hypothetical protein